MYCFSRPSVPPCEMHRSSRRFAKGGEPPHDDTRSEGYSISDTGLPVGFDGKFLQTDAGRVQRGILFTKDEPHLLTTCR